MAKAGSGYTLQAGDGRLSDAVNTGFILDMQRKLYRWSAADPDKRFADLFNVVFLGSGWPVTGAATRRVRIA